MRHITLWTCSVKIRNLEPNSFTRLFANKSKATYITVIRPSLLLAITDDNNKVTQFVPMILYSINNHHGRFKENIRAFGAYKVYKYF